MQGSRVKALQEGLNTFFSEAATGNVAFQNWLANNSYLKSGQISTDGIFSAQTKEAVKVFQEYWSLAVDGIVGKDTWTALYNHNYVTK
jgi:peptidoglycan hydrolase-like protein with peptidoglycan-binding domain